MSQENLSNKDAIEKLKTLVDKIDIGMLCTYDADNSMHSVPMSRQEVDDDGNIWYLFSSQSDTHANLQKKSAIDLLYSDVGSYTFLAIKGTATVSQDKARIDKYWNKMVEAWFEKGKEDPTIRVLKVVPNDAHYWDNKTNKLVTFFKVATSVITGEKMDIGREGDLDL